jgi:hypothetical protein
MEGDKILKIICVLLAIIVISSVLIYFFIPNFQFRTFEMNRTYSVIFGLTSILLSVLLFFLIKNIQTGKIRRILTFINGFGLIISSITLFVFYKNIDPDIQFKDYKVLYVNKQNSNEKIIRQFDVNWKTNEKEFQNNVVEDFGIFRIYKSYGIDTLKLDAKWK